MHTYACADSFLTFFCYGFKKRHELVLDRAFGVFVVVLQLVQYLAR